MPATDYDRLKDSARRLLRDARAGDPAARSRVESHAGPRRRGETNPDAVRLADCLHTVAREAGFRSWPRLKLYLRAVGLDRSARERELESCLAEGQWYVVDQLLEIEPELRHAHLGIELALLDEDAVRRAIAERPGRATQPIGRRSPILHLCFSRFHRGDPDRQATSVRLACLLLENGADPNDAFTSAEDPDAPLSALYGALGHADNLPLAHLLIDRGADPNDGESLYHATELGHTAGLTLLYRAGARTDGTNALYRALDRENPAAVRLMIESGADPNEPLVGDGPCGAGVARGNTLHHAARRMRTAPFVGVLLDAGANPETSLCGHSPYAVARAVGNDPFAAELAARGLETALTREESIVAALAAGSLAAARAFPRSSPFEADSLDRFLRGIPSEIAAFPGRDHALAAFAAFGFDPEEEIGAMSAVHVAAWHGHHGAVRGYLNNRIDLERQNAFGGTLLGTAIHGSSHAPATAASDHVATVAMLLDAGARVLPEAHHLVMGSEEVTALLEERLE